MNAPDQDPAEHGGRDRSHRSQPAAEPAPGDQSADSDTHPDTDPDQERATGPAAGCQWRVERIDTEPMTTQQHDDAVRALAALIATWQESTTRESVAQRRDRAA